MIKPRLRSLLLPILPLLLAAPVAAKPNAETAATRAESAKPFYVIELRKGFARMQDAVDAIGAGKGTLRIASGTYRQCAVQTAGEVAYVAAEAGSAVFDGTVCDEKAALILRGAAARLDGLVFQNIRFHPQAETPPAEPEADDETTDAPEIPPQEEAGAPSTPSIAPQSYAAIALEAGSLSILNSLFRDSDAAITAADIADAAITIRQASFTALGQCRADSACPAALSIGRTAKLRLFSNHFAGAPIASRSVVLDADDNRFEDQPSHPPAEALLALPSGGVGRLRGNEFILHHAPRTVQQAVIAVAEQDKQNPSRGLLIDTNEVKFAEGVSGTALFVANYSGEAVSVGDNQLSAGISAYQRPGTPARP